MGNTMGCGIYCGLGARTEAMAYLPHYATTIIRFKARREATISANLFDSITSSLISNAGVYIAKAPTFHKDIYYKTI